jgi:hypothetical protein
MLKLKPDYHTGRNTFGKYTPTRSCHLKVQLRKSIVENDRIFSLLFDEILYEACTNPWVNGLEEVCNLGSWEFNILRLKYLSNDEVEGWIISVNRPTGRTHLESDVLVLLENPSGVFEDLVHVFFSQLLKVHDSWLKFLMHIGRVLTETERRLTCWLRIPAGW